jgi:hypothetical protein
MPSPTETWKRMLLWLLDSQRLRSDDGVPEQLLRLFPPAATFEVVERALKEDAGSLGSPRDYVYLNPPQRSTELQPIIGIAWTSDPQHCSLRVRLLLCKPGDVENNVEGLGFRFEAPEGPTGRHTYFHAQLFRLENVVPGSPAWLPDKEPTLPLVAGDEVQLVVALAVALYGAEVIAKMADVQDLDLVRTHIDSLATYLQGPAEEVIKRRAKASRGKPAASKRRH